MMSMISTSQFVITDSGALQREAFYLGKRAVVLQDSPFWRGLTDAGFHRQSGSTAGELAASIGWARAVSAEPPPSFAGFGKGQIGLAVVRAIVGFLENTRN
jgi:UDP-N-acetylglucosamine 2-epimerase